MSEELAEYGAAERAEEITQRRGDAVERPRTTTICWHRPAEQMPPYGMTVVVWIPRLALVMRALRDARHETMWRIAGSAVGGIRNDLVAAWTDAPNGPLPPPDGGAA